MLTVRERKTNEVQTLREQHAGRVPPRWLRRGLRRGSRAQPSPCPHLHRDHGGRDPGEPWTRRRVDWRSDHHACALLRRVWSARPASSPPGWASNGPSRLFSCALRRGLPFAPLPASLALFTGTLVAGAAIGMAGVLLPVVIRRRFPERIGSMTGLYTMILSVGGASAAGLTPILEGAWRSWTLALASWSVLAFAGGIMWSCPCRSRAALRWHSAPAALLASAA